MENQNLPKHQEKQEELSHKIDSFKVFLIILAVILVISNIITVYFLLNRSNTKNEQKIINNQNTNNQIINENQNTNTNNEEEDQGEILNTNKIIVNWYPKVVETTAEEIFEADKIALNKANSANSILLNPSITIEKIGEVQDGLYSGSILYNILVQEMGISKTTILKHNNDVFILNDKKGYAQCDSNYYKYLCKDKNIIITNLETPEIIAIPNSDTSLEKKTSNNYQKLDDLTSYEKLFEYTPNKFVYQSKDDYGIVKYFAIAEDHTIRLYQLDISFMGEEGGPVQYFGMTPQIFDIVWSDGLKNTDEFLQNAHAVYAGGHAYANYISNINDLKIVGQIKNNEPIYELKDINTKENPKDKQTIFEKMYSYIYTPQEEKISFEDFLTNHPIIFWQDPFGNFLEFKNALYMPAAEFGKPVIYLYPENTTDVSVKVYPNNGLSITEPAYNNGWFVKAEPDGSLYNYNDKQNYPYLFWEGYGLNYYMPQQGFVVFKDDIKKFLIDKLSQQGLIAKEYNEFIDFWAPKMTKYPYYFITFMPQIKFNQLAPLEINPKPDTIIRIFMDYKGLNSPIKVKNQTFKTPQRNGFTVVEWGGVLHN